MNVFSPSTEPEVLQHHGHRMLLNDTPEIRQAIGELRQQFGLRILQEHSGELIAGCEDPEDFISAKKDLDQRKLVQKKETLFLATPDGMNIFTRDRDMLSAITAHFAAVVLEVKKLCDGLGIIVERAMSNTGEVIVRGAEKNIEELSARMQERGWLLLSQKSKKTP